MKLIVGSFHPGMRYLVDFAIAESTKPDDPSWAPRRLDWTGRIGVREVVQQWAGVRSFSKP
jgi:hypothetical protein